MEQEMEIPEFENMDLTTLSDEVLGQFIETIIAEVMHLNRVYYDMDDVDRESAELAPIISALLTDPRTEHMRYDFAEFIKFVTYLTIKLG